MATLQTVPHVVQQSKPAALIPFNESSRTAVPVVE
jgi:hypothetical protein